MLKGNVITIKRVLRIRVLGYFFTLLHLVSGLKRLKVPIQFLKAAANNMLTMLTESPGGDSAGTEITQQGNQLLQTLHATNEKLVLSVPPDEMLLLEAY